MSTDVSSGPWCSTGLASDHVDALRWVAIDVETTGLDPTRHVITEFAAFAVDANGAVRLGSDFREESTATVAHLRAGAVLVAHNLAFDLAFLNADPLSPVELRQPRRWLCTLRSGDCARTLEALGAMLAVQVVRRHTAEGDAGALGRIIAQLLRRARGQGGGTTVADTIAPLCEGKTPAVERAGQVSPLRALRPMLDHVVPMRFPSREQRHAMAYVSARMADAVVLPTDHDQMAGVLRNADVTASVFDRLLTEQEAHPDT